MNLKDYVGKQVRVIGKNGTVYVGNVIQYTPAPDNASNEDAIALDSGWWLDASDIREIHES